jgi:putative membrane protein
MDGYQFHLRFGRAIAAPAKVRCIFRTGQLDNLCVCRNDQSGMTPATALSERPNDCNRPGLMKALCAALLLFAFAAASAFGDVNGTERKLMVKLGQGDASEFELANKVMPHASSARVRDFANLMITDHQRAFDDLERIAKANGVTLTREMDDEHKSFEATLARRRSGVAYDRTYMDEMVKDHENDTREVQKAIRRIHDPALALWAHNELKIIQKHLRLARVVRSRLR